MRQGRQSDAILLNNGAGWMADTGQVVGGGVATDVALGDLDGDGDLDAFRARYTNIGNSVTLNDGNGNFTDSGQALGSYNSSAVSLGDVDGDGDLDAIVANYYFPAGNANRVYLNDGTGTFTDSGQALGTSDSQDVALGDLDGDGDLDAVFANRGAPGAANHVYLNDGSGNYTDTGQLIGNDYSTSVALADLDGDGDLDMVVGNSDPNSINLIGSAFNRIYLNDGNGTFTDSGQTIATVLTMSIAIGDVDGDGPASFSGSIAELLDGATGENIDVLTTGGVIGFSDVDTSDTHTASFIPNAPGYLGTLTLNIPTTTTLANSGSVSWSYSVDDVDLDHLTEGDVLTQIYDVTIDDGNGGTAVTSVTITLTGAEDTANGVNIVDLHSNPSSDSDNPTIFSGVDGEVDVYVYDFTVGRQAFEYTQVNNFDPDEDYFVFTNFELNGDGIPYLSSNQPEGYESMTDRVEGEVVSVNGFNIIGNNPLVGVIQNNSYDTGLGGSTDRISIYLDEGNTGAADVLSDGNVGYANGPVTEQLDHVLVYEGDYLL